MSTDVTNENDNIIPASNDNIIRFKFRRHKLSRAIYVRIEVCRTFLPWEMSSLWEGIGKTLDHIASCKILSKLYRSYCIYRRMRCHPTMFSVKNESKKNCLLYNNHLIVEKSSRMCRNVVNCCLICLARTRQQT